MLTYLISVNYSISHLLSVNQELSRLLRICIDFYNNALTIIQLNNFCPLLEKFDYTSRKSLALYLVMNILENETQVTTAEQADSLLTIITPLIKDDETSTTNNSTDAEEFAEEQGVVARYVAVVKLHISEINKINSPLQQLYTPVEI